MSADVVALLYLAAGVLFILALRGLSSPETSRQGNLFGMIGMAIAILTTLAAHAYNGEAKISDALFAMLNGMDRFIGRAADGKAIVGKIEQPR